MSVSTLVKFLENIHLGGAMPECLVTFEGGKVKSAAMDISNSLFAFSSTDFDFEDCTIGIGNLALFIKYLKSRINDTIIFSRKGTRLTIKRKGGGTVSYLLSQPELISTYQEDWEEHDPYEDAIKTFKEEYDASIALNEEAMTEFLNMLAMFNPNQVTFEVLKKGKLVLKGGREIEHQFQVDLGKVKLDPCKISVNTEYLKPVLSAIDYTEKPKLYITDGMAIGIKTSSSIWMVLPVRNDE